MAGSEGSGSWLWNVGDAEDPGGGGDGALLDGSASLPTEGVGGEGTSRENGEGVEDVVIGGG